MSPMRNQMAAAYLRPVRDACAHGLGDHALGEAPRDRMLTETLGPFVQCRRLSTPAFRWGLCQGRFAAFLRCHKSLSRLPRFPYAHLEDHQ
jgi:hypothetical protein